MRLVTSHSSAYAVPEVSGLFVVENAALERLLFDRNRLGLNFSNCCVESVRLMLGHLIDELHAVEAELLLLSKGLLYQLANAVAETTGRYLPTNVMATRRVAASREGARIEVPYARFDNDARRLLIGDTVASGATIRAALDEHLTHYPLDQVYIVSLAGSIVGAREIQRYCRERAIDVTMVFGLAAFGLGDNGFDLSFLHGETVTARRYRERAFAQFDGRPVSAVGWDFGSQAMAPAKYRNLCWVEAEVWGLHGHASLAVAVEPDDIARLDAEASAFVATAGAAGYRQRVGHEQA